MLTIIYAVEIWVWELGRQMQLYKILVRLHSDHWVQICLPLHKDILLNEWRDGLDVACNGGQSSLGEWIYYHCHVGGWMSNLVKVYKIMRGLDNQNLFFPWQGIREVKDTGLRWQLRNWKGNLKGKCLTQRAVNIWNELAEEVLSDDIITYLKNIWMGIWIRRTYKQIGLMWADGIT